MPRFMLLSLLLIAIASGGHAALAEPPAGATAAETRYLTFQLMTGLHGYRALSPCPAISRVSKAQRLEGFVHEVVTAIGTTGRRPAQAGFRRGTALFRHARRGNAPVHPRCVRGRPGNDVAVAFHIDDSMSWGERKDLLVESGQHRDGRLEQDPNTGRRDDWGFKASRFSPQMCFNSPAIVAAVQEHAGLIGAEIKPGAGMH